MIRSLTIDYGDEVLLALGLSPEQFHAEAKILIAVKLQNLNTRPGRATGPGADRCDDLRFCQGVRCPCLRVRDSYTQGHRSYFLPPARKGRKVLHVAASPPLTTEPLFLLSR